MQREIKFRAWDKKHKEMILDIAIFPEYNWLVMSDNDALAEREQAKKGQIILMQYTGLNDKNGKEIYEGDIVSVDYKEEKAVVEYEHGGFIVRSWIYPGGVGYLQQFSEPNSLEVIGNIYSNPDLLK